MAGPDSARGRRRWRLPAVWLALAALAGGIIVLDRTGALAPPPRTDSHGHALDSGPRYLVRVPVADLTAAEIVVDGETWRFDRDEAGTWRHSAGGADDPGAAAHIALALEVFGRAQVTREITGSRDVKAYGVLTPGLSVLLYAGGGVPAARYFFGDVAPDGFSRYVLVFGEFLVVTVPEYHAANLTTLAASFGAP